MSEAEGREALVITFDEIVKNGLDVFRQLLPQNPGPEAWGPWGILAHLYYRHLSTALGVQSAAMGGPPWALPATNHDHINSVVMTVLKEESYEWLIDSTERAHRSLIRAIGEARDWDAPAWLYLSNGKTYSVSDRIEIAGRHWRTHTEEVLRAAPPQDE